MKQFQRACCICSCKQGRCASLAPAGRLGPASTCPAPERRSLSRGRWRDYHGGTARRTSHAGGPRTSSAGAVAAAAPLPAGSPGCCPQSATIRNHLIALARPAWPFAEPSTHVLQAWQVPEADVSPTFLSSQNAADLHPCNMPAAQVPARAFPFQAGPGACQAPHA